MTPEYKLCPDLSVLRQDMMVLLNRYVLLPQPGSEVCVIYVWIKLSKLTYYNNMGCVSTQFCCNNTHVLSHNQSRVHLYNLIKDRIPVGFGWREVTTRWPGSISENVAWGEDTSVSGVHVFFHRKKINIYKKIFWNRKSKEVDVCLFWCVLLNRCKIWLTMWSKGIQHTYSYPV